LASAGGSGAPCAEAVGTLMDWALGSPKSLASVDGSGSAIKKSVADIMP